MEKRNLTEMLDKTDRAMERLYQTVKKHNQKTSKARLNSTKMFL